MDQRSSNGFRIDDFLQQKVGGADDRVPSRNDPVGEPGPVLGMKARRSPDLKPTEVRKESIFSNLSWSGIRSPPPNRTQSNQEFHCPTPLKRAMAAMTGVEIGILTESRSGQCVPEVLCHRT